MKSPISISLGITNGISRLMNFICRESVFPSPVLSTVKILLFGGKIFLIRTLNADKSYEMTTQPSNLLWTYNLSIN
ncbi:MAG: hypothetical protein ACFFCV_15550 [Promethearchaeota archaeon]